MKLFLMDAQALSQRATKAGLYLFVIALFASTALTADILDAAPASAAQPGEPEQPIQIVPLPGDVNCSGAVDILDAWLTAAYTVGIRTGVEGCPGTADEINLTTADVSQDGDVNILDATLIARCSVGLEPLACSPPSDERAPNDDLANATRITPTPEGWLVDENYPATAVTIADDERNDNDDCVRGPSLWYRFEATSSQVGILHSNDDQDIGIYRAAEGITDPTTTSELELISCGDVYRHPGAIVEVGETYWISNSEYWEQHFWVFSGPAQCVNLACPNDGNDNLGQATPIDLLSGEPVVVPPNTLPSTRAFDEDLSTCVAPNSGGSQWYRIVAPTNYFTILSSNGANAFVVFEPNRPIGPADHPTFSTGEMTAVGCLRSYEPIVKTVPGTTYFIAAVGDDANKGFTASAYATHTAPNDELVNATEVFPSADGFSINESFIEVVATVSEDEGSEDDCIPYGVDEASLWYRFEATSRQLSVLDSNDDQYIGIYRAIDGVTNPTTTSDLELLSCDQIQRHAGALLEVGETYWISNAGYWSQQFWLFDGPAQCVELVTTVRCPNTIDIALDFTYEPEDPDQYPLTEKIWVALGDEPGLGSQRLVANGVLQLPLDTTFPLTARFRAFYRNDPLCSWIGSAELAGPGQVTVMYDYSVCS